MKNGVDTVNRACLQMLCVCKMIIESSDIRTLQIYYMYLAEARLDILPIGILVTLNRIRFQAFFQLHPTVIQVVNRQVILVCPDTVQSVTQHIIFLFP